jgi:hypothetical protein
MTSKSQPFFPGYTSNRPRETLLKRQNFKVVSGLMDTRVPDPSLLDLQISTTRRRLEALETFSRATDLDSTGHYVPDYTEVKAPETVVLRFFAFFKQSLTEANDETYRVRYVRMYYYMEDDTIMIEEHRERNSGMPQGVVLRRMRVENPHAEVFGTIYNVLDFNVGVEIDLCGIVYHIYDCDDFTRKFLTSKGIEMPSSESAPEDLYTVKRKITERPIRVTNTDTDKTHLRDFLDFDGKVLRFYTYWDDRGALFGEKRKFVLHFFLVDKTIEIRQVLPPNSGRVPVSQFLRKTLLKKPGTGDFYTAADLYLGQTVDVFGRIFFIYDADVFTRKWCDDSFGRRDWTPIDVDEPDFYFDSMSAPPPPYNGWGDEEDSLGYCYSLHPTPPRKDIAKLLRNQGQVLRFSAEFVNPVPQDAGRQFVICFDLADDQISVFERPRRNSGFTEGKFIQKSKIRNPATGRNFVASDLRLGEIVVINGHQFQVTGADEYALDRMEAAAEDFPQSDLHTLVLTLKKLDTRKIERLKKQFEMIDQEGNGYVDPREAMTKVIRVLDLREHEATTIVRRFTEQRGFDYFGFIATLV